MRASAIGSRTAPSESGSTYKPLILLIWLGAVIMAFGGAVSLTDRRFRVGAPVRAKAIQAIPAAAE